MGIPYTGLAILQCNGSPIGVVFPQGVGQLCIDRTTPALYQATGFSDTDWVMVAGGGGGSITEIVAGSGIDITDGSGPTVTVAATGGGGGIASMSGAGVDTSPGLITQAGGFNVNDTEYDGISLETNEAASLAGSSTSIGTTALGGNITVGSGNLANQNTINIGSGVSLSPVGTNGGFIEIATPALPFTITAGINDTLVVTRSAVPTTITVTPGVYNTIITLTLAITNALSTGIAINPLEMDSDTSGNIWFITGEVNDTVTAGPTDILSSLGFSSLPITMTVDITDILGFFTPIGDSPRGVGQMTVTGNLSAIVDANVKAVLTSIMAAIAGGLGNGYNLVLDGTT